MSNDMEMMLIFYDQYCFLAYPYIIRNWSLEKKFLLKFQPIKKLFSTLKHFSPLKCQIGVDT